MSLSPSEIQGFISSFEERLAPAEKASSEAWWTLATTGTTEAQEELVRAGMDYNRLFTDKDEYELVKGWYEGRRERTGGYLKVLTIGTNALVLESLLYKVKGKLFPGNSRPGYYEYFTENPFNRKGKCFAAEREPCARGDNDEETR